MVNQSVARRYARAMLGAVVQIGTQDMESVGRELAALADTLEAHAGLRAMVLNPAIDADSKAAVLHEIAQRLGARETTKRFVSVLAERERLALLPAVARAFAKLVDEHEGVIDATIASPEPLDDVAVAGLQERLARSTGRRVRLRAHTDPSLLGGLAARIGDTVYDGSLRLQLDRMRQRLTERP